MNNEANNVTTTTESAWTYFGDVNLEYGGYYWKCDDVSWDYADVIRITDLDSGCGFDGGVLVERLSAFIDPGERMDDALACIGYDEGEYGPADLGTRIDAALAYGLYDPAGDQYTPDNEILQTMEDEPMGGEGWKATKRVLCENLAGYVRSEYLD